MHGKASLDYVAFFLNPPNQINLGFNIDNLATTIFIADANNNIIFFTDNNILYMKPIIGSVNTVVNNMYSTIISISLDDILRIIVIGTTNAIQVFSFDNSQLTLKSLYTVSNTWALNYRLHFDPIFYRVIIDFDISTDKASHTLVDWILLNK
jgi:hypothetical protein